MVERATSNSDEVSAVDGSSFLLGAAVSVIVFVMVGTPIIKTSWTKARESYFKEQIRLAKCKPVDRWLDGEVVRDKTCVLPDGTILSTQ